MIRVISNLYNYRELVLALAWKNISLRYKQTYLGLLWALLKPVLLMFIFTLVKSFVGIDSGNIPYPILVFSALMPWLLFQESASEGISSVVNNANLVRKIYFPREVFPLTAMATKLIELMISFFILALMMIYYQIMPTIMVLWLPFIIFYTMLVALTISLFGAALNVYFRDVSTALPVVLSLFMYASPVIYPLSLVQEKLLVQQAAGDWSNTLYFLYTMNPLAGIIDSFQGVLFRNSLPDINALLPGVIITLILLPLGYVYFKRAEIYFADVI